MNIEEIKEKINNNEYSLVPDKIAIGEVIKIHIKGDLNIDGYETGYLYLRPNTGIKEHEHINDIERYKLIIGTLKVQGINTNLNICNINKKHNIDIVDIETIIEYTKINKDEIDNNVTSALFDKYINE